MTICRIIPSKCQTSLKTSTGSGSSFRRRETLSTRCKLFCPKLKVFTHFFKVYWSGLASECNRLFPLQVSVSMKFNGKSGVQVRTPPNLADLAAYTSMKLHVRPSQPKRRKRSTADSKTQFVFFLGNKNVRPTTATQRDILWLRGTNACYFYNHVCCVCSPITSFWAWCWRRRY